MSTGAVVIELRSLRLLCLCGALPEEQQRRQPYELDIDLVASVAATATDRLDDTLDYGAVLDRVVAVTGAESFQLFERMAQRIAEVLLDDERVDEVTVTGSQAPTSRAARSRVERRAPDPAPLVTGARRALLALGSNMGDRVAHLRSAVDQLPDVGAVSSVYETPPVSDVEQGPYLNMVVRLRTGLGGLELLEVCRACERAAGRAERSLGPRTLDVDVLWVDGERIDDPPELVVPLSPHVRAVVRAGAAGRRGARPGARRLRRRCGGGETASSTWVPGRPLGEVSGVAPSRFGSWGPVASKRGPARPAEPRLAGGGAVRAKVDLDVVGEGAALVVIATPDDRVAEVASAMPSRPDVVVATSPARSASTSWPRIREGQPAPARRLARSGHRGRPASRRVVAVAGDPLIEHVVTALGGRPSWSPTRPGRATTPRPPWRRTTSLPSSVRRSGSRRRPTSRSSPCSTWSTRRSPTSVRWVPRPRSRGRRHAATTPPSPVTSPRSIRASAAVYEAMVAEARRLAGRDSRQIEAGPE
ncbi:MAG: 2-amino-4-hydroxy-6-hydroxymethyldihydropteridine diphosphokinase [Acidimicrobiales bacterium]